MKGHALAILEALFDATLSFDLHRLPELFCGFRAPPGEGPTLYPVACAPQAWASGAVLLLLQACLGMEVSGAETSVVFWGPLLPASLPRLEIRGLRVAGCELDLEVVRSDDGASVNVLRREGDVRVVTEG